MRVCHAWYGESCAVRSAEGQVIHWPRRAALRAGTLRGWMEETDGEGTFPTPLPARALEALRAELAEGKHGPPHRFELTATDPETMGHPDWTVVIEGPAGSLYEGQRFTLTVEFPPESPFKPPIIKLCSPIYHFSMGAHADGSSGRSSYICFLNGHDFRNWYWSPGFARPWYLFDAFIEELSSPGKRGPHVELDTFKQWKERRAEFEAAARRCAQ